MWGTIGVIGVLVRALAEVDKKHGIVELNKKKHQRAVVKCAQKKIERKLQRATHNSVVLIVGMENGPTGRIGGSARIRVEEAPRCDPG